jgi:predicted ATP-grasp superfamily ATP-dependent carboligase
VKPDDGCGAIGARRHRDHDLACADYTERWLRNEEPVMEPWIEGEALSLSLLCGDQGAELLAVNRQHLSSDADGYLRFDGVSPVAVDQTRARAMATLGRRIAAALPGLAGFVGADITWHPRHGPFVIEVNPRVTCAYEGLSARLGRNIAAQVLSLHRSRWPGTTR